MPEQPVISIHNLDYSLGQKALEKQILFDIHLTINAGEIVIMTGPSGSGKTTLLTLIGGLRSIQRGSLKFIGKELRGADQSEMVRIRRRIGYIFQAHNLLPFLTARQNVQMGLEFYKDIPAQDARSKSEAMLRAVGLGKQIHLHPNQLSGGQKQRVAIARALIGNPKLVLADEPTASLDGKTGRDVVTLMQQLAKEQGCSILLVTHDNRILDVADRILSMEDGRLVES
ncbi:DevA family ABC transporter ATP-binding protein [Leptolyngbya sp. AN03gr2]|uniref:DevA family ABC transporter ATP-binding protein n=1 Tax=unclassified Leptolyngbya TaxID=2650499 RepID=UPI003D30F93F